MCLLIKNKSHQFTASYMNGKILLVIKKILKIVAEGYSIECINNSPPHQYEIPFQPVYNNLEGSAIDEEILNLLKYGVVEKASYSTGQFVSTIFSRLKQDGSVRIILNLEVLNQLVQYHHFKMDTFSTVLPSVTQNKRPVGLIAPPFIISFLATGN